MKEKEIRVLRISPGEKPVAVTLVNELHALQDAVSIEAEARGLIELVGMEEGVDIMLNEEGKLLDLPPNRLCGGDVFMGTFYVVGVDGEYLASLAEDKMEKYRLMFDEIPDFDRIDLPDVPLVQFFPFI